MTPEEAIKTIELAKAEVEWNYPMDYAIAFEMAIKVLKKQIPQKCIIKRTPTIGCQSFFCPACDEALVTKVGKEWLVYRLPEYCDYCGQALDWGNGE